jgi:ATP-dependent helicase HrpB
MEETPLSLHEPLPIEGVLPDLKQALASGRNAVLVAEPGAGKTTRVPLALLDEPWLEGRRIVMLEPRRLAARSAARFMAAQLGESAGETVGYRVRMDTKVSPKTRVEVVTEGVLTRMLQDDPGLEEYGLVIFDEFHERSLQADLGLALCLQTQELLREDLRLLVMSATMDAEPVARLLGDAPVIRSEGRSFPVETFYRPTKRNGVPIGEALVPVAEEALAAQPGDVLVFLPGMAEIREAERRLKARFASAAGRENIRICALHGSLPAEEQDRALAPSRPGERKIVLATSVAETSLTVEGVTAVIDSGLARISRFSPRTGMSRLETVRVSAASADQRRGRAGRLAPGKCYRMWSEEEQRQLKPALPPEIREADLAPLVLELAVWGAADPGELRWLDPPPAPAVQQARELLLTLGALRPDGTVTDHGRQMAALGINPRLAHMIVKASPLGLGGLACEIAALLSERDSLGQPSGGQTRAEADFRLRLEALHRKSPHAAEEGVRRRLLEEADRLKRLVSGREKPPETPPGASPKASPRAPQEPDVSDACGLLLALAYPDRIGRRRDRGKYLLANGRGAMLDPDQPLASSEWIAAADVEDAGADGKIRLAAPLAVRKWLEFFPDEVKEEALVAWDSGVRAVRARIRRRIGAILLEESPMPDPPADRIIAALLDGIRKEGLDILPWTKAARQFQQRAVFMRRHNPDWPNLTDASLLSALEQWLAPYLDGMKSAADLQRLHLKEILESMIPWNERQKLEEWAPSHWTVPSGSRIAIDYSDPDAPVLAVRLQELFGLADTPKIAGGRVPLTLHLLSPAMRPVQVTRDLASFWRQGYFEVRKDLKGRYPKHHWPDNPLEAPATRGTRRPGQTR